MIILDEHKITPNQAAKWFLMRSGIDWADYYYETVHFQWDEFTEREIAEFEAALDKQTDRLRTFFNM
jgi:hypothetical protein